MLERFPEPDLALPARTVHELLLRRSLEDPRAVALESAGERIDYGELMSRARAFADVLGSLGVKEGDRVALVLRNRPEFVVAFFGSMIAGAIVAPLDPEGAPEDIAGAIAHAGARVAIVEDDAQSAIAREAEATHAVEHWIAVLDVLSAPPGGSPPPMKFDARAAAVLAFAGPAREPALAAKLTHANLLAAVASLGAMRGPSLGGRTLAGVPMFHVHGLVEQILLPALQGGSAWLHPDPQAAAIAGALRGGAFDFLCAPAKTYLDLMDEPSIERGAFSGVRRATCALGAMPSAARTDFRRQFGIDIFQSYNSYHAPAICGFAEGALPKTNSVGLACPGVELRIACGDGTDALFHDAGEIAIRAPQAATEFWTGAGGSQEGQRDGWLMTGDVGWMDNHGYVFVAGRKGEEIARGGAVFFASEIEERLYRIPQVREARIHARRGAGGVEAIEAVVRLKPGAAASCEEILDHLRLALGAEKIPDAVSIVEGGVE